MAGLLLLRDRLSNSNQNIDGQQSHTILVITSKMLEQRDHFFDDNGSGHAFHKLGQIIGGLSPHHRRVIMDELSKLLTKAFL